MIHAYYPNDVDYNLEGVNPGQIGSLIPTGDHTILGIEIEHNQLTPARVQCDQYGEGTWETVIEVSRDWHAPTYFRCHTGSVRYLSGTGGKKDVVLIYYLDYIDSATSTKTVISGPTPMVGSVVDSTGGSAVSNIYFVGAIALAGVSILAIKLFHKFRTRLSKQSLALWSFSR